MQPVEIETPQGMARAHLLAADRPRGALLLGHGAGGGITARDLVAVAGAAHDGGLAVALIEQPYRVAGRRNAPRAPALDSAWLAVVASLRAGPLAGLPLVVGGRSSGARVACRTAAASGAVAVLCLAFPLQPPTRASGTVPPDRLAELEGVAMPVLVVQGDRDQFGMPPPGPQREIAVVHGDHALRDTAAVVRAVGPWLAGLG